jgi:hypothetical protein
VLKTLCVLEAVLLHGPDRALEETMDMKTDIKALQSFTHSDFNEAGKVQAKANEIIQLLEDGSRLQQRRAESGDAFGSVDDSTFKYQGFSSKDAPKSSSPSKFSGGFDAKFDDDGFASAFDAPASAPATAATSGAQPPDPFGSFHEAPVAEASEERPLFFMFAVASGCPRGRFEAVLLMIIVYAPQAAPAYVSANLSGSIGKISINMGGREGGSRRAGGGGVSLGALPTPAAGFALPHDAAVVAVVAKSADDDFLGLMDVSDTSAALAAPPPSMSTSMGVLVGVSTLYDVQETSPNRA